MRTKPNELEQLKQENARLQKELEIAKLRKENRDLQKEINDLNNGGASSVTYIPMPGYPDWSKYTWTYSPDEHTDIVLCASDRGTLEDFKDMLLKD